MKLLLRIAGRHIPTFIRKRELQKLFRMTASAFGTEIPPMVGFSYNECLSEYARFTRKSVDQSFTKGDNIQIIQDRLFQQAYEYGKMWRKIFNVSSMYEAMEAAKILYQVIGIEFRGTNLGAIEIDKCFFSQQYSPETCKVISSLDAGIMAGLSGDGSLSFSQRITEGFSSCKAHLTHKEFVV
jgi:hypothetical protein